MNVETKVKINISTSSSSSSSDSLNKTKPTLICKTETCNNASKNSHSGPKCLIPSSDSSSSNSDSITTQKPGVLKQRISPLMFLSNSFKSMRHPSQKKLEEQNSAYPPDLNATENEFSKETRKWYLKLATLSSCPVNIAQLKSTKYSLSYA